MANDFHNASVISFESRRAAEMADLITRFGGRPISAPSMREVPLSDNAEALAFAQDLLGGQFDALLLLTGVGTRALVEAASTRYPRQSLLEAIGRLTLICRGPKPVVALREMGITPTIVVPAPNTWQDVLKSMDQAYPPAGKRIAVQEYGMANPELLRGLEQRGAQIRRVPVYQWALPLDLGPLRRAIETIIEGQAEFALFTSATQVFHLIEVAGQTGQADALRQAMKRVVLAAVGPIASEALERNGLAADYEPDAPHMTHLVKELAARGADLLEKKRLATLMGLDPHTIGRLGMRWNADVPGSPGSSRTIADSVFMKACRRQPVPHTPVWMMRQAGRYQRHYRQVRDKVTLLELCKTPELSAQVTLMAAERLGVDAAIIFADILLPIETLGFSLDFLKGEGPVISNPITDRTQVQAMPVGDPEDLAYVYEALRMTRRALRPDIALIGFAGAPFTIASYLLEGGKSTNFIKTRTMMHRDPQTWDLLMTRMTDLLIAYVNRQVKAGADAIQLFDSWAGCLGPATYRQYVLPYVTRLVAGIKGGADGTVPVINFLTGNPALLKAQKEAGATVMGLDWRVDLAQAWAELGHDIAVQGNLDPALLYCSESDIRTGVQEVLDKAAGRPGHIFNLGHGILPDVPAEHALALVQAVHDLSAR